MSEPPSKKQKKGTSSSNGDNGNVEVLKNRIEKNLHELKEDEPVLSFQLDSPNTTPSVDPSSKSKSSLLECLLFPLSPDLFLKSCFRQKAVHISSSLPSSGLQHRIQTLIDRYMFGLDPQSILRETSSDNAFVWLQKNNKDNDRTSDKQDSVPTKPSTIKSIEVPDVEMAIALHESGHATYCRAPPELEQLLVSKLLSDTGMGCGQYDPSGERSIELGRGEVEVFMGTRHHITDWHYDFQENFTIQLSGSKRWTLKQGRVKHPLRGCTPHYAAPEAVESQLKAARLSNPEFNFAKCDSSNSYGQEHVVDLNAGDVLYFPAGMWHKVETTLPGVSINVSLMATNFATITCQALQHLLLKHDGWRECVVNNSTSTYAVEKLQGLLQELPKIIQNFANNNGAASIIPPVLQQPPNFQVDTVEDEDENDDESGGELSVEDMPQDDGNEMEQNSGGSEEAEEEIIETQDEVGEEDIIDIDTFEGPSNWTSDPPGKNYVVRLNPLAFLTKMKDITDFYKEKNDSHDNYDKFMLLYVLNVNFAGNETHESSVRVVLKDSDERILERLVASSDNDLPPYETIPSCLFFYGYVQWVAKKHE